MVSTPPKFLASVAVVGAVLYQMVLKDLLWTTLGLGRKLELIDSFGFRCERVEGLGLEACEDMWLHEPSGLLYLVCSDTLSKVQWTPSIDHLNASGRGLNDRMAILDTRASGPVKDRLRWMEMANFDGINGDGTISIHGFDVQVEAGNPPTLQMLLVNHRAPVDPVTGAFLDASKVGANSTIELFETTLGETEMRHLKTYHHLAIQTPNKVAFVGKEAFVLSNDKSSKVGFRRALDILLGGGNIAYCNSTSCHITASSGFNYPNGLIRGTDGLIYVPNVITGEIHVMELQPDLTLKRLRIIATGYPLDNLSKDSNGDIFAAGFPQLYKTMDSSKKPFEVNPPTVVLRIRKVGGDYEVKKVLEDDGSVLPGATIAAHDPGQPEKFFLGGFISPFISICEAR